MKIVAEIIANSVRKDDIVARIGGDEFAAFLYDGNEKTAKSIQKRIMDLIKINNEKLIEKHLNLSVSSGYAINQGHNDTIEELMKKADSLMYEHKMNKS